MNGPKPHPPPKPPPPGWGLNSLTTSFDMARENQFATFHHNKMASVDLVDIERVLRKLVDGQIDPRPILPMHFFLRSHSTFRAAAACAMAGQAFEAAVLLRSALESAAYGLFIGGDENRAGLWFSRSDSKSATDRVRNAFGYGSLRRYFEEAYPALAAAFVSLYEVLVDFGGHPNEAGYMMSTSIREEGAKRLIDTVYLHDGGLPLEFALKNSVRVCLWAVLAYSATYPGLYYRTADVADVVERMRSTY